MLIGLNNLGGGGVPSKVSFMLNGDSAIATSTNSVNDGQWHQVVGTYEKGGQSRIFVDGAPSEASVSSQTIVDRGVGFMIGGVFAGAAGTTPSGAYSGLIDDVQIYSGVLTDAQIDLLFSGPGRNIIELEEPLLISPDGGNFVDSVQVMLTTSVAGTVIRYTLDGSDPGPSATLYSAPFTLTATTTVKAILFVGNFAASSVRSATFTKLLAISFQPPAGLFTNSLQVTIVNNLATGSVFYTADQTDPTTTNTPYQTPVNLTSAATLRARVFLGEFPISAIVSADYARVYALDDGVDNAWREQYFGPNFLTDPRVSASADPDGDGWTNLLEYQSGTDPTDDISHPTVIAGIRAIPLISWNSITGLTYRVLRKPSVSATNWDIVLQEFVADQTNSVFIDANAPSTAIYEIEVVP
jgi:hypothetical protein